ncbi:hypothetical protein D6C78_02323 [Aureobasidium pullulans]|uniref:Ig-like domain-containing protein n=2 Tax=Aureobasidium pullulans TaxID=5580 RepID=A0A074XB30_AURPU|nr:uncharacterized protein M438DRAFT_358264 [Aureobasidium pullulans EXF-150]KEQ80939.1 hypothetical protein M438DRAFT_358264 [Aureobasidium pullulans EXF-150]THW18345.1 hypothetical protein D6D25_07015 [Aureobasidium pullulans]THZ29932.1 hypothetical protein D6C91_01360 [Aureobasidium pullulans]TIA40776.1 hypothetical protein D6C78_02323 [Aureobasidium pullulans]
MQHPFLLLLACNLASALPLHLPAFEYQRPLKSVDLPHTAQPSTKHLDRVPRSAELLFTASDDDEMVHVWLPLGKRIYTRDYPVLPLHPTSARISNVLGVSTEVTARHKQQQVTCIISAGNDSSERKFVGRDRGAKQAEMEVTVSFQEGDRVVRFDGPDSTWHLKGREVKSYECF